MLNKNNINCYTVINFHLLDPPQLRRNAINILLTLFEISKIKRHIDKGEHKTSRSLIALQRHRVAKLTVVVVSLVRYSN